MIDCMAWRTINIEALSLDKLSINITTVSNTDNFYNKLFVSDLIKHTIIATPDSVSFFRSYKFFMTRREWVVFQRFSQF